YGEPIDKTTYDTTIRFFEELLRALHPFMPFITEELWHELKDRPADDCIIVASWPVGGNFDARILEEGNFALDVISEIRNCRNTKGLSPKESIALLIREAEAMPLDKFIPVVKKLSNLKSIESVS